MARLRNPSFAILTSAGASALPVILQPDQFEIWLRADFKIAHWLVEGPTATG